ncbi:MAG: putative membrane protein, partial [Candidatus Azotimanducaceae bacterium]
PDIVSIRSHGKEMEIGSFLNKPDKSQLIAHLRRVVYA